MTVFIVLQKMEKIYSMYSVVEKKTSKNIPIKFWLKNLIFI
jgi:hypothetical protein